ncbi:unnamed protein product [Pieris macdunnoughi]|uniref:Uncharacterized protein n=1 Tax=Pieris macdunnoughi TaxID=345717 RepID=A0A821V4X6_9NEOP|nr:unnamed protein product [Pieris macdunnoughi]
MMSADLKSGGSAPPQTREPPWLTPVNGPPADKRSQTKKSIGRQPLAALTSRQPGGRRFAVARRLTDPAPETPRGLNVRLITDTNSPF